MPGKQNAKISAPPAPRWGKYGAPAAEADPPVSPLVSDFELQAHYVAGRPKRMVKLMRLMLRDFMLEDPRMTNSTFIEGYSTIGDLHYAPYTNESRISHAHAWSTGLTSVLTIYAAGLQVQTASGQNVKNVAESLRIDFCQSRILDEHRQLHRPDYQQLPWTTCELLNPSQHDRSPSPQHPPSAGTLMISGEAQNISIQVAATEQRRVNVDKLAGGSYEVRLVVT